MDEKGHWNTVLWTIRYGLYRQFKSVPSVALFCGPMQSYSYQLVARNTKPCCIILFRLIRHAETSDRSTIKLVQRSVPEPGCKGTGNKFCGPQRYVDMYVICFMKLFSHDVVVILVVC